MFWDEIAVEGVVFCYKPQDGHRQVLRLFIKAILFFTALDMESLYAHSSSLFFREWIRGLSSAGSSMGCIGTSTSWDVDPGESQSGWSNIS